MLAEKAQFSTFKKLSRSDVRYLALEGGGGKGFAYVGALRALEELGVVRPSRGSAQAHRWTPDYLKDIDPSRRLLPESIHGIAGSSAGAITALLLSCGYDANDIQQIMLRFDFNKLFEPPTPRRVPRIQIDPASDDPYGAVEKPAVLPNSLRQVTNWFDHDISNASVSIQSALTENLPKLLSLSNPILARFGLTASHEQQTDTNELRGIIDSWMNQLTQQKQDEVKAAVTEAGVASILRMLLLLPYTSQFVKKKPKAIDLLLQYPTSYTAFLSEDLGLFAGHEARRLFAEVLAYKLPLRNGKPWYNATFQDHYEHFGVTLAVTGTNFETKKGGVFSWKTTPNFPVADAIRISMSMPLIFKPVIIRPEDYPAGYLPNWVNGVWVDGGYLDNIPLHIFDTEDGANPKTLGLRLSITDEQPVRINNIMEFLTRWANFGVWGTGEAHINEPNMNIPQTILFDTAGLSSLDFAPDPADRDRAIERAYRDMLHYFEE